MKRMFLACALLLAASGAAAQSCYMARTGVYEQDGQVIVSDPTTTLAVDLTVQTEEVICGPYARYAQKFFGVRAPLTDKTSYLLTNAAVSPAGVAEVCPAAASLGEPVRKTSSHSRAGGEFARIQPDKVDMTTLPLEDAAREAAAAVFSLRKHRMELITGEAGENVFGAGLESALNEIERLEQSYLELFLGKRIVTTGTRRILVRPTEGKRQYILCRFTPDQGLVSGTDLSGELVLLQIDPSGNTPCPYEADHRETSVVSYRIADPSTCTVTCGNSVLSQNVIPIFQFGRTVKIAVPRKR